MTYEPSVGLHISVHATNARRLFVSRHARPLVTLDSAILHEPSNSAITTVHYRVLDKIFLPHDIQATVTKLPGRAVGNCGN